MATKNPILIIICGWAISGKGTVAKGVSDALKIHWIDIDEVRTLNFGPPNPNPNASEDTKKKDNEEMKGSYYLLYSAIEQVFEMERSLIVTATFSRIRYWKEILDAVNKHQNYDLKVVWCVPKNDSNEEISKRLAKRVFSVNSWSAVNSLDRYKEVKDRFKLPPIPYIEIDTSPPNTPEKCVEQAVTYILS